MPRQNRGEVSLIDKGSQNGVYISACDGASWMTGMT